MKTSFQIQIPREPLNRFIQFIWIAKGDGENPKTKVLPNGVLELIFNLGGPQKVIDRDRPANEQVFKRSWIAGLQNRYIIIQAEQDTDLAGIRFRAGGAWPFFDRPVSEFTDRVVEADLIFKTISERIREKLFEAGDSSQRAAVIEEALAERLKENESKLYHDELIRFVCGRLKMRQGPESIKDIVDRTGYSHKHLLSVFHKKVGLTPKKLARIYKLQQVIDAVKNRVEVDWTQLACDLGYYDQSHLISDFREFGGLTPEEYLRYRTFDENHCFVRG